MAFCARALLCCRAAGALGRSDVGQSSRASCFPLDALVDLVPSAARKGSVRNFSSPTGPGITLGYYLQPGGRWPGDYLVLRVQDTKVPFSELSASAPLHRTREVLRSVRVPSEGPM